MTRWEYTHVDVNHDIALFRSLVCGSKCFPHPVFQSVELQSLWQDQPVVVFFLRRFGCQVCRWMASEISKLEPDLRASGVALVGVGPEEFGLKEFKEGGFFKGCK